jgi:Tfp pilus assembly protein PilO
MNTSTRRIGAVTGAVAVVLLLIWYAALLRPQMAHARAAHAATAAAEAKSRQLQAEIVSLRTLVKDVPADKARLATYEAAVPATPDLNDLLVQLHADATTAGVSLTSVTPGSPTTSSTPNQSTLPGDVKALSVPMAISGPYHGIVAFLTRLTAMPRVVVVDGLDLSPVNGGLTASLTVRVFYGA